jgi:hypothetical protein
LIFNCTTPRTAQRSQGTNQDGKPDTERPDNAPKAQQNKHQRYSAR